MNYPSTVTSTAGFCTPSLVGRSFFVKSSSTICPFFSNNRQSVLPSILRESKYQLSKTVRTTATSQLSSPSSSSRVFKEETTEEEGTMVDQSIEQEDLKQLEHVLSLKTNMEKYSSLMHLLEKDTERFFRIAQANLSTILPIIYTPVVGEACVKYSDLDIPRRGTWLNPWEHKGRIYETLSNLQKKEVSVIVVSDCQRILGLGDLGANGMPIPVGKLLLYSACGGIDPSKTLPIVLDVGCDIESIRNHPNYLGVRKQRIDKDTYNEFVNEFMYAAQKLYGKSCLIQFEDFGNNNAARLLSQYRNDILSFNDDIQGTAAVGLAGILAALNIDGVENNLDKHTFLFLGAGSAGIGIADLIVLALVQRGIPESEARKRCWFMDSKGLIYNSRGSLTTEKEPYAHNLPNGLLQNRDAKNLNEMIDVLKPSCLIGVSTQPGSFSQSVIEKMCTLNKRPIIFALSNPTSKSECTAEEAYKYSNGKAVFASGSPFDPVLYNGFKFIPGQGNNCFIFPGLGLGVSLAGASVVDEQMVLAAAQKLADLVSSDRLASGCVYPSVADLLDISAHVAKAVWNQADTLGVSGKSGIDVTVNDIRNAMYEPGRVRLSGY